MKYIFLLISILPLISLSQVKKDTSELKVYLKTDINYASSAADTRKEAQSATGTLGIKFQKGYLFGSSVFTIHSQNEQIATEDNTELKLFGSSLLLPQNSSSNMSNFELHLGADSFYKRTKDNFWHVWLQPIGFQFRWRVNNTVWDKSSVSIPLTISSVSADLTYRILDVKMDNFGEEKIRLITSVGYVNRRLGGDYGLDENIELRKEYLGTSKLAFDGFKFSTRLEVSKFYGQIDLTSFSKKDNIRGFSGDQAVITIGIRADLGLPTKFNSEK